MPSNMPASSARSISERRTRNDSDARPLDEVEYLLAVLLADRVAEDRAEQPDVLAHRLGGLASHLGAPHRTDRCQCDVGDFGHRSSIGAASSSAHGEGAIRAAVTIGVVDRAALVLAVTVVAAGAAPTGTIGVGGVEVLVESESELTR